MWVKQICLREQVKQVRKLKSTVSESFISATFLRTKNVNSLPLPMEQMWRPSTLYLLWHVNNEQKTQFFGFANRNILSLRYAVMYSLTDLADFQQKSFYNFYHLKSQRLAGDRTDMPIWTQYLILVKNIYALQCLWSFPIACVAGLH